MNPVTEHITTMMKALLKRESEEMRTGFELFNDKREQVAVLLQSLKPLVPNEADYDDALAECDVDLYLLRHFEQDEARAKMAVETMTKAVKRLRESGQINKEEREDLARMLDTSVDDLTEHFTL